MNGWGVEGEEMKAFGEIDPLLGHLRCSIHWGEDFNKCFWQDESVLWRRWLHSLRLQSDVVRREREPQTSTSTWIISRQDKVMKTDQRFDDSHCCKGHFATAPRTWLDWDCASHLRAEAWAVANTEESEDMLGQGLSGDEWFSNWVSLGLSLGGLLT